MFLLCALCINHDFNTPYLLSSSWVCFPSFPLRFRWVTVTVGVILDPDELQSLWGWFCVTSKPSKGIRGKRDFFLFLWRDSFLRPCPCLGADLGKSFYERWGSHNHSVLPKYLGPNDHGLNPLKLWAKLIFSLSCWVFSHSMES